MRERTNQFIDVKRFQNPAWQKLKGRENRMANQFGQTDTALDYQPKRQTVGEKVKTVFVKR